MSTASSVRGGSSTQAAERKQTVLIAGDGIGGLATAVGLAQAGFGVTVPEQAQQLGEIGAGIQLGPNAFHTLDFLGVGEAALDGAVFIDRLVPPYGVNRMSAAR